MENLTFKTITSDSETKLFLDKVENYTNVRLPPNYTSNSRIVGAFLHDKLVAGYMIVTKPNFRSLLFVPDSTKKTHSFFSNDKYEMMEVNGLWIGPAIKTPNMQFKIWTKLAKDIFFSKKKYVLLMSNSRNKSIEHLHSLTNPEILYKGAPKLMNGHKTYSSIQVSFTTRWNIVFNFPKYLLELQRRKHRAEQFGVNRTYIHE